MVFVAGGILASDQVLGWLDATIEKRIRSLGRRGDADGRPLLGRVTHQPRSATPRIRRPSSPARDRIAADDRGGRPRGVRPARRPRVHRGRPACDRARPDGRRAGAGGRHRRTRPFSRASGPERRERAQRRHLRAASPDRHRDRRSRGRRDRKRRRAAPRARGDRLRLPRRRDRGAGGRAGAGGGVPRGLVDSMWLQVVPIAGAARAYGLAVWMRRKRVHRRLRRRRGLRRAPSRDRRRGNALPRGGGQPARRGDIRPLRRRHARADSRRPHGPGRALCASQPDAHSDGSRRAGDAPVRCSGDRPSRSSAGSGRVDWRRSCSR